VGDEGLTEAEIELLIDGLTDYVDFGFALTHLGIRSNPPGPPSDADVDLAFAALGRMSERGLIRVGHMEYDDGGPPGRLAPIHHVEDPLSVAKSSVLEVLTKLGSDDWRWNCWVENTDAGIDLVRAIPHSQKE
jgi:hypothetical protein